VTRTLLSGSKCQRSTCRGGAHCGGLPHSLFKIQAQLESIRHESGSLYVYWFSHSACINII